MNTPPVFLHQHELDALPKVQLSQMPPRDELHLAMFAAWLNVRVDQLPGEFKQFHCVATMTAWTRVADVARSFLTAENATLRASEAAALERAEKAEATMREMRENLFYPAPVRMTEIPPRKQTHTADKE